MRNFDSKAAGLRNLLNLGLELLRESGTGNPARMAGHRGRATLGGIRQPIFFVFAFNGIGVAAAGGLPGEAAAMALSSFRVVSNAEDGFSA